MKRLALGTLCGLCAVCACTSSSTILPAPETVAAPSAVPSAAPSSASSTCLRACEHYRVCVPDVAGAVEDCQRNQCGELTEDGARSFGACLDALSCKDLSDSLAMDMGPVGLCFSKARS
jgi:hypothetical protein